jgi:hypothetical protein
VKQEQQGIVRQLYTRIKNKLSRYRKETVTMMIVPHNQKGVKNYHFSYLSLLIVLFLLFSFFTFSLITVGRYTYYVVHEKIYIAKHDKYMQEMGNLINNSGKLIDAQQSFDHTLNRLLNVSGLKSAINLNVGTGGPLENIDSLIHENKIDQSQKKDLEEIQEINGLKEMSENAQQVKNKIQKLSKKIQSFEVVMKFIPSLWPLLGDGEIQNSKNGVMNISTLPYTPVVATAEGKVAGIIFTSKGVKLTLIHKYQFVSMYNGLFSITNNLKKNSLVHKGQVIGYVAKNKGQSILSYGLFVGNEKGLYPLDPSEFSYLGR